jgi:uncharacterized protein YcnI
MNPRHMRVAFAASAAAVLVLSTSGPALAHITVNPSQAQQGGFTALVFRVPNERDDASTVSLAVQFPTEHPIPFVSVKPHPGWIYKISRTELPTPVEAEGAQITEAVSAITWTAAKGSAIKPGEFDEFAVSVGPLPDAPMLLFPAVQTYSDGEVVRWIEPPSASGEEPELPAPALALVPGAPNPAVAPPPPAPPPVPSPLPAPTAQPAASEADDSGTDPVARWLAAAALLVGLTAGLLAGLARRRPGPTPVAAPGVSAEHQH